MRRLVTVLLLLIVPVQFAWSAVVGVQGHLAHDKPSIGIHAHGHDHDHDHVGEMPDEPPGAEASSYGEGPGHCEDGHYLNHYHPVFSSILIEHELALSARVPDGPIMFDATSFFSHISPPLDRPPLALA